MENTTVELEEQEVIYTSVEELKRQARELYIKLLAAHERKDWLNFKVLSDQLQSVKEDLEKIEADTKDLGIDK